MRGVRLHVSPGAALRGAGQIESAARACGLRVTMKGTLAKYPGCRHWHLKRGRERGTLEVTLWPAQRRLWLSVQEGRKGNWIPAAIRALVAALRDTK